MKRILLFVHYNKNDKLDKRVLYTLSKVRHLFKTIVVISNSKLSDDDLTLLNTVSDRVILRSNIGFDFSAWKDGIDIIGWPTLKKYESMTLMNDTFYFPIWPIDKYFEKFDKKMKVDFWGASLYRATSDGMPETNGPVPEHLQSYFMTFKRKVIASKAFANFWGGVKAYSDVRKVVQYYETALTGILKDAGFGYDAIVNMRNPVFSQTAVINPIFQAPLVLLDQKFPFIKLKAVSKHNFIKIRDSVKENSKYPAKHINAYGKDKLLQPLLYAINFMLKRAHFTFLAISIPAVITFSLITPLGFGGDEVAHTYRAYSISEGQLFSTIKNIPKSLSDAVEYGWNTASKSLWGVPFYDRQDLNSDDIKSLDALGDEKIASGDIMVENEYDSASTYPAIMHLGAAIGFYLGEKLDLSIEHTVFIARLLNAIPFFILGALAIYVLRKSMAKWIIFTILLVPTVISYAATINGDPYNIASVVLFSAIFLRLINNDQKISKKDLLLLAASSLVLAFAKLPSVLLVGLLLFIKKDRFSNIKDKWLKMGGIITAAILLALIATHSGYGQVLDQSSTPEKISWSISHPIDTAIVFGRTIFLESSDYLNRAVGVMGRNGVFIYGPIIMVIYIWLTVLALSVETTSKKKGLLLLSYGFFMCLVVIGLLYAGEDANTVGSPTVWGLHGKYFTPFIPIIFFGLSALAPFKISSNKNYIGLLTVMLMTFITVTSILSYKLALY